jgi:hypothetical protein
MIKPLNARHLSKTETRTGLQSISDLLPRLIRQYEIQSEMMQRRTEASRKPTALPIMATHSLNTHPLNTHSQSASLQQATFGWDD